ncbi:hypothetical protein Ddye_023107 [Dipteronia dyeriana]|uniref:Receptor-like serine/threonine-protein kinase n=1 Tax=Dipteronia dyeriana TaxID=168575 RepID=A0AAD9TT95_9ROSI|nr:hypothetical protein Ddye_023107 [Dipteronia dyeriana]
MAFPLVHFLCILLLLLIPHFSTAQSQPHKNVSLGESLTAGDEHDESSWNSPSGEFAFGFQKIDEGIFLLAIYFNKIPEKTIVWSAKTKNPVQRGSKLQLTGDGWLTLTDPIGNEIWTAGAEAAYGAMLDAGNFVLAGRENPRLWDSFDHPTDTILPTQILNRDRKLTARYSEKNYSSGRFELTLRTNGNLVLYTIAFPLESANSDYWSTKTAGSGFQLIFNQSGNIYLIATNESIIYMLSSDAGSEQDFYRRAILEHDGVFRHYVYPKNTSSSIERWGMQWSTLSFTPPNICMIEEATGNGACGFNGYCRFGDDQRPTCQCPRGYTFLDPNDFNKGCKQSFVSQNCSDPSLEVDRFIFDEMQNTDWPLSDYEHFRWVSEDWCRRACLGDCFCAVAIFRKGECWKKKIPLSNGRIDPSIGGIALIKRRKDDSTLKPDDKDAEKKNRLTLVIVGSLLLTSSVFLNIVLLGGAFLLVFCFGYNVKKMNQMYSVMPGMNLQSFTYNELEKATNGFKEELGRGGFATVYKGILALENRKFVAVKKLDNMVREGEKEFRAEVSAIGQTNHKNLVKLLGFCNEEKHRLLVYELISNGSLANFLFRKSRPNWYQRRQIVFGIARGLFYLHEECTTRIIHCDIKPQNILLDDSLTARISDFGLAKMLMADQTRTTTAVRGTKGYVAPEWFRNLPISVKVDVYSFGIVLLELICCRKNVEQNVEDENQMILADWAYDCYRDETLHLLVENDEEALHDMKRVKKYVMIAIWCIQEDPSLRPSMKKVTQMIEEVVEVSTPPDPSSFTSSNISI